MESQYFSTGYIEINVFNNAIVHFSTSYVQSTSLKEIQ